MKRLALAAFLVLIAAPAWATNTLFLAEFVNVPTITNATTQIAPLPVKASQTVDYTAGAAQSTALNAATKFIYVNCNIRCSIKLETGSSTVATTDFPLGADSPQYFAIPANPSAYKLSVIASP